MTHPTPHYIRHPLNNSTSKSAYSFAKHPRFGDPPSYFEQPSPNHYHNQLKDQKNRYVMGHVCQSRDMEIGRKREDNYRKYEIYTVRREVDDYIRQLEREGILQKSKQKTLKQKNKYLLQEKQQNKQVEPSFSPTRRFKTEYSPIKESKIVDFTESPSKTAANFTKRRSVSPINMTVSGYYPLGMQFSSKGRYVPSTMRNVSSLPFSSSPSKDRFDYYKTQPSLGPGYYTHFSEFGPLKHRK